MDDEIELINLILNSSPYQCTIGENEIGSRIDLLSKYVIGEMKFKEKTSEGVVFNYQYDKELAHHLLEFSIQEQICCPFFNFNIEFLKSENALKFYISAIDKTVDIDAIIDAMMKIQPNS